MMSTTKIIQYIHRPNNTELGKGNTHESYMLIPSNIDVSSIFPSSVEVVVTDSISGKKYRLKSASGKEFRVNQMGDFYRDYSVNQGDEIIITNVNNGTDNKRFISIRKFERVAIITSSKGSEIINIEKLDDCKQSDGSYHITLYQNGMYSTMKISFLSSQRKRSDSPNTTDYYNVAINGNPITVGTHYITLGQKNTFSDLQKCEYSEVEFDDLNFLRSFIPTGNVTTKPHIVPTLETTSQFRPFLTAIRSKPFLLLAGISGTGKSRIVRELARACWDSDSEEYKAQKPKNFEMIQVKPNWHDSTELIGYVSRASGAPEFVAGDFLKFVVKAWEDTKTPYFLCLDEMNLAPVEQYFAEYLSVIESRKFNGKEVVTDPILKKEAQEWYHNLVCTLTEDSDLQQQFLQSGISIPKNLIVIGTVNMDETTFAFSRKVLDRAMTIEMNEVDLHGGLTEKTENIGKINFDTVVGNAVEGVDVYDNNQEVCDTAIDYLQSINDKLNGTPFKIAYRTRNEFLLYVVNNLPYSKDEKGNDLNQNYVIARALDEIT